MVLKGLDRKKERTPVEEQFGDSLQERDNLDNLRLDLDRAKTLLKRAKDDAAKKQSEESNANVMDAHKEALQRLLNAQREYHQSCLDAVDQAMR
ncbi:hypothetical protein X801_06597 [Opisthorchis viverrini]|uniref:BAR domain-containing protein n=1 Tax=Opisthorchis viverrini TaxID=6198 RepID=A0A1S8WT84_OPIVI|nr:hypothetical protein X801_06597 [Opisthorchis viverrini]